MKAITHKTWGRLVIFELAFSSVKTNHENVFPLKVYFHANELIFMHIKSLTRSLVLKQRHGKTRKRLILYICCWKIEVWQPQSFFWGHFAYSYLLKKYINPRLTFADARKHSESEIAVSGRTEWLYHAYENTGGQSK